AGSNREGAIPAPPCLPQRRRRREGARGVVLDFPPLAPVPLAGRDPPHPARLEVRGEDASRFHASMSERMGRELTLAPTAPGPCLRDRDARRASERGSPASEPGLARSGYCGPLP